LLEVGAGEQAMTNKTDAEIQKDVLQALSWDSRVSETEIGVSVHNRTVTLTGTVNSWGKRLAAQEAAHRVAGVADVANDVEVKLAGSSLRDDTDIAKAARFALRWDVSVPQDKITMTVAGGVITLEGQVELVSQRDDAAYAVAHLSGVRDVCNHIRVVPSRVVDDIKTSLETALLRHAEREAEKINLKVFDGGVVEVGGHVQSWAEKRLVLGAIKSTAGVRVVKDNLYLGA
jgi:osmotically-inducible protein OsmY